MPNWELVKSAEPDLCITCMLTIKYCMSAFNTTFNPDGDIPGLQLIARVTNPLGGGGGGGGGGEIVYCVWTLLCSAFHLC